MLARAKNLRNTLPMLRVESSRVFAARGCHAIDRRALFWMREFATMVFHFSDLVGRYRLVVTDELVAFVERVFVEPAEPSERERVRREAIQEANLAELEVHADGTIVSRAGAQEFYRVRTEPDGRPYERFEFEKAPGMPVTLVLESAESLLAYQPGKPVARFRRVTLQPPPSPSGR